MEKKQTVVDYLIDEVILDICFSNSVPQEKRYEILDVCFKARKMFKEQIVHAATYGANAESPEKYYNGLYPNVS